MRYCNFKGTEEIEDLERWLWMAIRKLTGNHRNYTYGLQLIDSEEILECPYGRNEDDKPMDDRVIRRGIQHASEFIEELKNRGIEYQLIRWTGKKQRKVEIVNPLEIKSPSDAETREGQA